VPKPQRQSTQSTPTRARKPRRRGDWRPAFLAAFEQTGVVAYACEQAGIDRSTAYKERQRNEDFAVAWADAEERGVELLEAEARRRAAIGVDRPVFYKGEVVETVKEYSDQLSTGNRRVSVPPAGASAGRGPRTRAPAARVRTEVQTCSGRSVCEPG
jgi:hypothetical protein